MLAPAKPFFFRRAALYTFATYQAGAVVVIGLATVVFALYLASALLNKKRPQDAERHVTMLSFLLLVPTILTQPLSPLILPLLSLFFTA